MKLFIINLMNYDHPPDVKDFLLYFQSNFIIVKYSVGKINECLKAKLYKQYQNINQITDGDLIPTVYNGKFP